MFWVDIRWSCVRRGKYKWEYVSNLWLLEPDKQSLWNLSFKNKLKNIFSYHSYYHPSIDVNEIFQCMISKHFNAFTEWYIQMMSYDFNNFRALSNDFLRLFCFESFRKKIQISTRFLLWKTESGIVPPIFYVIVGERSRFKSFKDWLCPQVQNAVDPNLPL